LHVVVVGDGETIDCRRRRPHPVQLGAQAPPLIISSSAAGREALPLPAKPRLTGKASAAWIMRAMCQGPGVQVVAKVPCAGPVPPPSIEVTPDISASTTCCGQMK
jgi:hypothetical protein